MKLGTGMNEVFLIFSPQADREVEPALFNFMNRLVSREMTDILNEGKKHTVISLSISSTSEPYLAHKVGGPHRNGLAIDIAAVNGKSISALYRYNSEVQGICDALQVKAIEDDRVFENFGPLICFKSDQKGNINQIKKDKALISMHKSHLHFSVRA